MKAVEHDQAGVRHQPRDLADAADILDSVGLGEAEVAVEAVTDIVAIEQKGMPSARREPLLDEVGDGRLARARQAGEPQHRRPLALERACVSRLTSRCWRWTLSDAPKREVEHAAGDRRVAELVDQDEPAEHAVRARSSTA